jgi:hydroxyquinol 1,2-dioxygenase
MRNLTQDNITQAVIARLADTPDPRLKEIMTSLVQHLHAFAREVKLTEDEWFQGIEFLTRVGHITDDKRQEFILLSDTLGLSMLTVAMNNDKPAGCTEATVFGPFYVEGAPTSTWARTSPTARRASPAKVRGTVRGLDGEPVPGAEIHVWQADAEGKYDVQREELDATRRAACCMPTARASTTSAPSWPRPIRSPTTARWATC